MGAATSKDGRMFCPKCGTQASGMRCQVCGSPIASASNEAASGSPQLSGWWRRVGATIVDELILVLPTYAVLLIVASFAGTIVGALAGSALGGVYMVKLLTRPDGQTLGNRAVATYVRDATTGHVLTTQQALKRWGFVGVYSLLGLSGSNSGTMIVGFIGLVDCLYPLFNERNQTLHDKFANTIVLVK